MRFDVLTLFPQMFSGYLGQSLLKKAIDRGLVDVQLHDIRSWSQDKHQKVDEETEQSGHQECAPARFHGLAGFG